MAAPAAAPEELPVLVGLYMTVTAVITWIVWRAIKWSWINTVGAFLQFMGHLLQYDKGPVHIHWGDYFFDLNTRAIRWIRGEVEAQEYAIGWWWHQTTRIQGWIAHEIWAMARDAFHFGGWLVHTYIPTFTHGVTNVYHSATRTVVKQVTRVEHVTTTIGRTVVIPNAGELQWIHKHWRALTRAVAAAGAIAAFPPLVIPRILDGIHDLRARLNRHNLRLTRLEKLFGVAAFAALMANVLGLPNWRCLTRGNVGRFARALCGLDQLLANALLADLAIITGTLSIVEFAKALQKAEPLVATSLAYLVDDLGMARDDVEKIARRSLAVVESIA